MGKNNFEKLGFVVKVSYKKNLKVEKEKQGKILEEQNRFLQKIQKRESVKKVTIENFRIKLETLAEKRTQKKQ